MMISTVQHSGAIHVKTTKTIYLLLIFNVSPPQLFPMLCKHHSTIDLLQRRQVITCLHHDERQKLMTAESNWQFNNCIGYFHFCPSSLDIYHFNWCLCDFAGIHGARPLSLCFQCRIALHWSWYESFWKPGGKPVFVAGWIPGRKCFAHTGGRRYLVTEKVKIAYDANCRLFLFIYFFFTHSILCLCQATCSNVMIMIKIDEQWSTIPVKNDRCKSWNT